MEPEIEPQVGVWILRLPDIAALRSVCEEFLERAIPVSWLVPYDLQCQVLKALDAVEAVVSKCSLLEQASSKFESPPAQKETEE